MEQAKGKLNVSMKEKFNLQILQMFAWSNNGIYHQMKPE